MIDKKTRLKIEAHVCKFYDNLDKTGMNTDYYKEKFAHMSDAQFDKWLHKKYPLQLHIRTFETEPTYADYKDTADFLGINLFEKVALPFLYTNKDGVPVCSKEALIIYLPIKRVQQMGSIKNHVSTNIDKRDPRSGRLLDESKSAQTSDREFEGLAIMGLTHTQNEFSTIKADSLNAKSQAYGMIAMTGRVSEKDFVVDRTDSISKNTISTNLLSAHVYSNLVNDEGYTPYTLKDRQRQLSREN